MGQTNTFDEEPEISDKNNYLNYDLTESNNIFSNYNIFFSCKQEYF
jgi:hypothetical protein